MSKRFLVSENMIMWSFRYALSRRTGAVIDVIEHLIENWEELADFTKKQIKREIKTAIALDKAGANCDVNSWKELLSLNGGKK